jgi:hypothetical protein
LLSILLFLLLGELERRIVCILIQMPQTSSHREGKEAKMGKHNGGKRNVRSVVKELGW